MLNTNVVSELMRDRGDAGVALFVRQIDAPLLSVIVLHELGYGADLLPAGRRSFRLATRNTKHLVDLGIDLVNPWTL